MNNKKVILKLGKTVFEFKMDQVGLSFMEYALPLELRELVFGIIRIQKLV